MAQSQAVRQSTTVETYEESASARENISYHSRFPREVSSNIAKVIYQYMDRVKSATVYELVEALGVGRREAHRVCVDLVDKGVFETDGRNVMV